MNRTILSKCIILLLFLNCSVRIFGQDILPNKAPIDKPFVKDSSKDNTNNNSESQPTEIPIIVDSTEGWDWIDNEKAEDIYEAYPLKMSYKKYLSHPQYRIIRNGEYYDVYDGNGQLVRVVLFIRVNRKSRDFRLEAQIKDELLRQTYITDYKNNKYNIKKENQNVQNYIKQQLKLITSSRYWGNRVGIAYMQQLALDHGRDFRILLKIERLNDTSFKLIFGDLEGNSVSTWKVAYSPNGQFKSKITVTRLPLEKIKVSIRFY